MSLSTPLPRPRLVAPGGPVTCALAALNGLHALPDNVVAFPGDDAPVTIPNLRRAIRRQLSADMARIDRLIECMHVLDLLETASLSGASEA